MKQIIRRCILLYLLIFCLAGCAKRNFFPDEDDPGLSRFTFHGYNIATAYINEVPYINPFYGTNLFGIASPPGNAIPLLSKVATNSAFDTLSLSWPIEKNDNTQASNSYFNPTISLLMPVPKSFSLNDFIALSGQRFSSNTNSILLQGFLPKPPDTLYGSSNIYFVEISVDSTESYKHIVFSGLFNGNVGDSILITKGRFDFAIDASEINF